MSILGEISAAAQFAQLGIELFKGCIEAYKFLYTAQHIGSDGDMLDTKLAVQYATFDRWAGRVGLPSNPDTRLNWHPIVLLLGQQLKLWREATELHGRYQLGSATEASAVQEADNQLVNGSSPESSTAAIVQQLSEVFLQDRTDARRTTQARTIRQRNNPLRKFTWAAVDKTKLEKIVKEITDINSQLVEFLHDVDQRQIGYDLELLGRMLVSHCDRQDQLETFQQSLPYQADAVGAAARLKRDRISLRLDQTAPEGQQRLPPPTPRKDGRFRHFNERKLVKDIHGEYSGWKITRYQSTDIDIVVLVEWRRLDSNWAPMRDGLKDLALLLTRANDDTYHSPRCVGYVALEGAKRFGFVYDVTEVAEAHEPSSVRSHSLFDLFPSAKASDQGCRFVSIRHRMRIAFDIAEAVIQLHTVGWLHKGMNSRNVRFIDQSSKPLKDVVAGKPHLVGYVYSRQTGAVNLTELPISSNEGDIYRHPKARGHSRQSFQRTFDLYGLACILIELALWERLGDILKRYADDASKRQPDLFELYTKADFREELEHNLRPEFSEAIGLCLEPHEANVDDEDDSTFTETDILNKLRDCRL